MSVSKLSQAIDEFGAMVVDLEDQQLDLDWTWQDYDSDGIRFAFFRTFEDLRQLSVELELHAGQASQSPPEAGMILGNYHAAFREMHALLLGVDGDRFETVPAEGQWPLRKVIAHMVDADVGFYAVISETLRAVRSKADPPRKLADEIWDGIVGMPIDTFDQMLEHDVHGVLAFHQRHHDRILDELSSMTEEELASPSYYWEDSPYPLRFRLGRFESHLRQHNIQIRKTRAAIGLPLTESQRLLLMIYSALAQVENRARQLPGSSSRIEQFARSIGGRSKDVLSALA